MFCLLNTDYYSNVNKNKDDSKKYLKWYSRFDSDYVKTLSNDPIGVRYESPTSAKGKFNEYEYKHNPDVLRFTKVGKRSLAKSTLVAPNTIPNMRPRNDIWTTSYQDTSESLSNKVWFMIIMQIQIDKGNHIEDKVNILFYGYIITIYSSPRVTAKRPEWTYHKPPHKGLKSKYTTEYLNQMSSFTDRDLSQKSILAKSPSDAKLDKNIIR